MKKQKFFKRLVVVSLLLASILAFQSCSPDFWDAFADGYRRGYYGEW